MAGSLYHFSKEQCMLKKSIFSLLVLMAMAFVVAPQVQAQTQAQQQELEQIARRSVNGLSPQDSARVVQIMTDVYMAQGMSRQQAASLAEMAANSMFTTDIGEMTPEQQRQFAEQDQRVNDFNRQQQQPQQAQQPQPQRQQQQIQGETAGWPAAAAFTNRKLSNIRQPAGTQARYTGSLQDTNGRLEIYLTGANQNTVQEIRQQIKSEIGDQWSSVDQNNWTLTIRGDRRISSFNAWLKLEGNVLTITFYMSAG